VSSYTFQSLLLPNRSICRLGVNCEAILVAFILSPGESSEALPRRSRSIGIVLSQSDGWGHRVRPSGGPTINSAISVDRLLPR
jgi:hypothetical protein